MEYHTIGRAARPSSALDKFDRRVVFVLMEPRRPTARAGGFGPVLSHVFDI